MKSYFFTEDSYPYLPDESEYSSIRIDLPNRHYDPVVGHELYNRYLDEWCAADELGLNIMMNEHHASATCTVPSVTVIASILARQTKQARLVILGHQVANRRDPIRIAEETAMIDVISGGRLEVGFVRGVPTEIWPTNSNPARTAERMWEAHDLILKAWTSHDGPFNWEGKYFHSRYVNIWPRPYQQPHPPVWVTTGSGFGAAKIAGYGHRCAAFLTGYGATTPIFTGYRDAYKEKFGKPASLDRLGYLALAFVGDTDEEGFAGADKVLWYIRSNKVEPALMNPPGFATPERAAGILKGDAGHPHAEMAKLKIADMIERGIVFAGNPDTVYAQIKKLFDHTGGFGHVMLMGQAGFLGYDETVSSLKLFAEEVQPRLDELTS